MTSSQANVDLKETNISLPRLYVVETLPYTPYNDSVLPLCRKAEAPRKSSRKKLKITKL